MAEPESERMTRWGIGPRLTLITVLYSLPVVGLRLFLPDWVAMGFLPCAWRLLIGAVLLAAGLTLLIAGAAAAVRAYDADRLCTTGAFRLCRHPIYGAWICFLIPGLALLLNSWLALTVPVVMYVSLRVLVREEEDYLEQRFGEEYRAYRQRVPAVLPVGWLTGR